MEWFRAMRTPVQVCESIAVEGLQRMALALEVLTTKQAFHGSWDPLQSSP
jgi:hypothetical protein